MTRISPTLRVSKSLPKTVDVIIVGLVTVQGAPDALVGATAELDRLAQRSLGCSLAEAATSSASATREHITVLPLGGQTRILVVGLGDADVTSDELRNALGAALRAVGDMKGADEWQVAVSLELSDPKMVQAAAEGALLGAYRFETISAQPTPRPVAQITLVCPGVKAAHKDAIATARIVAEAVCLARDWVNTPPNLLYPESFAQQARQALRNEPITVEILDHKALEKGGYGGLLAVGAGSAHPPRLVRLCYAPRGARQHLALVGKGITFDSGGLDLKPAGQMASMKSDMSGAAAVMSAIKAIAQLGLGIKVTAYAALAENLPSGSSYRASDVLTMFDGTTVENVNTDAEGRLVLADAIGRAGLDQPDLIVDVATLTGACVVALGQRIGGLITNSAHTSDLLLDAAENADEHFWELPLSDHIRSELKSTVADLRSGGPTRWGGALVAGAFLERFVPESISWAHLDIAGPAFHDAAPYGVVDKGGTGVAVRTLVCLAQLLGG